MTATIPEGHADILRSAGFAYVATLRVQGSQTFPQVSPTWFDWDSEHGHLLISLTDRRQKYHNVQREPAVAVCLTDPADPYRYLEVRGKVDSVHDDTGYTLINRLAGTYAGLPQFAHDPADGQRVVVRIKPGYVRAFGKPKA